MRPMNTIKARVREPSTWAGVGALITTAAQAYGAGGKTAALATVVSALLAILLPERATPTTGE